MAIRYQKIKSVTLKPIAYGLTAAEEGNVSAVARKLPVSQSAISST